MSKIINLDFKGKSALAYVGAIAGIFALVLAILGPVLKGFEDHSYVPIISVILAVGFVLEIAAFLSDVKWLPILPALFFAAALGLIVYNGATIIADQVNQLNWKNGDFGAVVMYIVLALAACICATAACFDSKKA